MWMRYGFNSLSVPSGTGVTIGAFDGVHKGHQALISRMVTGAKAQELVPLVVTFDPLPGQVLRPHRYRLLSTLEERCLQFEKLGVQGLVVLHFNRDLVNTTAGDFVQRLVSHVYMRGLWIGPDFKLGRKQEGDVSYLRERGQQLDFAVHVFTDTVRWGDRAVRSSRIREALAKGDIRDANGCLGHAFHLCGTVVHGEKRGRALGFPTANLAVPGERLLPANGVYICRAQLASGAFSALTNIGTRPTFDNGMRTVEAYLLDFSADIYGEQMQLDFLERLRPEWRFGSVEALIKQMVEDEANARHWLRERDPSALTQQAICPGSE